jgi:DNA polymerase-3 subunit chi
MTEIRFYHLQNQTQAQVLPLLLSKALERGMRIVVKLRDEGQVEQLNDVLWTYNPDSFLPHGSQKDGNAALQPVWLTASEENPNNASVLITGQGAESAMQNNFDLCCELLNGQDAQDLESARTRWKSYKDSGYTVTYWQQSERGAWEQKG